VTPPGILVDVGGYRIHLSCAGTGSPTVIVIGGFSFDWALVQQEVAGFTRICTYDTSGTAWSDPGPVPTCRGRVDELHRLLASAKLESPFVLVGLSTGALFARLYARDHPNDVAGLVFADHAFTPVPVTQHPVIPAAGADTPPELISSTPILFGVEDEPGFDKLPEHIQELHHWVMSRNPALPTAEIADACSAELKTAILGNLPLAVVSTANDARGYAELQSRLLVLSHHSRQFIAEKSFHSIEISEPKAVVSAIRYVVEAARN
jgi:pimeloyl-ACP methyl ester carboxylesterase